MGYTVPDYLGMVTDSVRVDAYARALQSVITPESFVIEIGTGIGVFAVMARRMGARRVVAIESNDAIAVAKMVASDNGATGIEFVQGLSTDISFSHRADVIVSDLRGVLPLYGGHLQSVIDARERLLIPGGTLIPTADALYAAVVELPKRHEELTPRFSADGTVKLDALRRFVTNTWEKRRVAPEQLLTEPVEWATIDYRRMTDVDICGTAHLTAERDGIAHGLAVWFDATLVDGVTFSNAPGQPELVYGAAFFPWPKPVPVQKDDEICVRFDAHHVADEYVWRWDTEIQRRTASAPVVGFRQSTFAGAAIENRRMARGAASRAVRLSADGEIERSILDAMDGVATNEQIARTLVERFPQTFSNFNTALGRVGAAARRFARD